MSNEPMQTDGSTYWWHHGDGPALFLEHCPHGVDHAILDVPYGAQVYAKQRKTPGAGVYKGGNHNEQESRELGHDPMSDVLMDRIAEALAIGVHRWALIFCDFESAHLWREKLVYYGMNYIRTGIWHKPNAQPQITGDRPASGCESIVICHGDATPMQWNRGGHDAFWEYPIAPSRPGRHPVEKPMSLMLELVDSFTNRGDLVADFTAGCATTGVAALRLGRKFFGVELKREYHQDGGKRLAYAREQLGLGFSTAPTT